LNCLSKLIQQCFLDIAVIFDFQTDNFVFPILRKKVSGLFLWKIKEWNSTQLYFGLAFDAKDCWRFLISSILSLSIGN